MRAHPILFSSPMVRSLLNTKLNTWPPEPANPYGSAPKGVTRRLSKQWLKAKRGDHLWVRETYAIMSVDTGTVSIARAERMPPGKTLAETDGGLDVIHLNREDWAWAESRVDSERWKASIFMPRWACRIELECMEDARLDRLQDITESDAQLEGVSHSMVDPTWMDYRVGDYVAGSARASFASLWQMLHNKPGERWDDNPELVRVGPFRRVR